MVVLSARGGEIDHLRAFFVRLTLQNASDWSKRTTKPRLSDAALYVFVPAIACSFVMGIMPGCAGLLARIASGFLVSAAAAEYKYKDQKLTAIAAATTAAKEQQNPNQAAAVSTSVAEAATAAASAEAAAKSAESVHVF